MRDLTNFSPGCADDGDCGGSQICDQASCSCVSSRCLPFFSDPDSPEDGAGAGGVAHGATAGRGVALLANFTSLELGATAWHVCADGCRDTYTEVTCVRDGASKGRLRWVPNADRSGTVII